ncbi:DNA/RNA non-specific endonuclease [Streptococcus suis]
MKNNFFKIHVYQTDDVGRLTEWDAPELQRTNRENRLPHDANTPGKLKGDHAGHLAGDRFGGSPEIDNLVSQLSEVNLSDYKRLENQWAKALEERKKVSVNVKVNYVDDSLRPSSFEIFYSINGVDFLESISNLR